MKKKTQESEDERLSRLDKRNERARARHELAHPLMGTVCLVGERVKRSRHSQVCSIEHDWEGNTGKYIPFKIDCICPTKGRDNTEVENGTFPNIARAKNCNNRFII